MYTSPHVVLFSVIFCHPIWQALNTEDWDGADPTDSEKDFWETAALEAYNHLGEWKSLHYCSTVNIDENSPVNLENMWNDSFFQVLGAILPHHLF